MKRCRHSKSWIIASGFYMWCYSCGALRQMRVEPPNISCPVGGWIKPVGDGENPYRKLK